SKSSSYQSVRNSSPPLSSQPSSTTTLSSPTSPKFSPSSLTTLSSPHSIKHYHHHTPNHHPRQSHQTKVVITGHSSITIYHFILITTMLL
ncbi:hypothetical protein Leryth_010534, partial [Lithospermum erythrorhizon]